MTARRPIDRRAPLTDVGGRGEPEVPRPTQRRATGTGEPTPNTLSVANGEKFTILGGKLFQTFATRSFTKCQLEHVDVNIRCLAAK